MEFRILGPLEIADDGHVLALGSGRQLALVALLLVQRNTVVPTDRIVDDLWQGSPPPTAAKIVRNSISLLRKELGDRLVTRAPGYLLRVEPGELDADRLESAVEDGRPETLTEALALWRGPPLSEVAYHDFARPEIERLEELHLAATEARIDAELAKGQHARLVPELETLVRAHPLRERLREQLMLALYRSGRQADALEAYQDARRTLDTELGLEPSKRLQALERKILNQDPTLEVPTTPTQRARRRSGLLIAAGAVALLAAGLAAGAIALTSGGEAKGLARVARNSVGVIDPETNRIVAQIPVGDSPTRLSVSGNDVWVLNYGDNSVSRIDAAKRVVLRTVALPGPPSGIAADRHGAWADYLNSTRTGFGGGSAGAAFIDGRFNNITRTVRLNRLFMGSNAVAVGLGSIWTADTGFVTRIDPETGKIRALIPTGRAPEDGVAVGEGAVWALAGVGVMRIDPARNEVVATIPIAQTLNGRGYTSTAIAVGNGAVWVANWYSAFSEYSLTRDIPTPRAGTVSRIDPESNAVIATITVGRDPFGVAAGDGAVWVTNRTAFTVSRIDPRTNEVVKTIRIGNRPRAVAVGGGAVWVSVA
jgi:YVTN family beta-propeller protein